MSDFELFFVFSCCFYLFEGLVVLGFFVDNVVKIVVVNLE